VKDEKMSLFFTKVYLWMFIGLLISAGVSYITSINTTMLAIYAKSYLVIVLLEFVVVIGLSSAIRKISPSVAKLLYILYSALNGFTLASIFMIYKLDSIIMVFLASALLFAILAIYGYITKADLTKFGRILFVGLIAIIIMSLINIFVGGSRLGIILSILSILIFLLLTAYDMQKLKRIYYAYENDEFMTDKMSIYGALDLYLDFINIFINLLRLFGRRRD